MSQHEPTEDAPRYTFLRNRRSKSSIYRKSTTASSTPGTDSGGNISFLLFFEIRKKSVVLTQLSYGMLKDKDPVMDAVRYL